jgi:pimeloyl-ACP methyl ester carboxylesterase
MLPTGTPPPVEATIQLRDGRKLAYLEVGPSDGTPLIHCHGEPSSRLEVLLLGEQAILQGVRLIVFDRPGIGRSDPKPGFGLLDWPDDVAQAANQLEIDRFATSGISGGGPFALACAYRMPERLTVCGLISAVPPVEFIMRAGSLGTRLAFGLLDRLPPRLFRALLRRTMAQAARAGVEETEQRLLRNAKQLGIGDQRVLRIPTVRRAYAETAVESYRQGIQANVEEALLLGKRWSFRVDEIRSERIYLWHGEQDRIMPVAPARQLAQALPHCQATFYADTGHLSTVVAHADAIVGALRV